MTLTRIARDRALPLELKVPNAETRAALAQSRKMLAARQARFRDRKMLINALETKNADKKRTSQPRSSDYTKSFAKDWEWLSRAGRFDMSRLKELILSLIANDGPLGAEWLDHPLKG